MSAGLVFDGGSGRVEGYVGRVETIKRVMCGGGPAPSGTCPLFSCDPCLLWGWWSELSADALEQPFGELLRAGVGKVELVEPRRGGGPADSPGACRCEQMAAAVAGEHRGRLFPLGLHGPVLADVSCGCGGWVDEVAAVGVG